MSDLVYNWLQNHGITQADLETWNVKTTGTSISIPIYSLTGKVAYVLVRSLTSDVKYRVTPTSAKKGLTLYGLNRALPSIIRQNYAVVVEGWSDVVALHSIGITNAVGIIGSTITNVQSAILQCVTNDVVAIGDGDEAGEKMVESVHRLFTGRTSSLVILGLDPSDVVAKGLDIGWLLDSAISSADQIRHRVLNPDLSSVYFIARDDGHSEFGFDLESEEVFRVSDPI
jgi:DNA primase